MSITESIQILNENGYQVKQKTSRSVIVYCTDREAECEKLQGITGAIYNPYGSGSGFGRLELGNLKFFLKDDKRTRDSMQCEIMAIKALNSDIESEISRHGTINIVTPNFTLRNAQCVEKQPGTPKADFFIKDGYGEKTFYISHKNGSEARDFQQWAGITEAEISKHPYVQQFHGIMNETFPEQLMPRGESLVVKLPDTPESKSLKLMACYGVDAYKDGDSPNKADAIMQGTPRLKHIEGNNFSIDANSVHYFPEIPGGKFEPALAFIYKGDRNQCGIRGARASISPIGGRNYKKVIQYDE